MGWLSSPQDAEPIWLHQALRARPRRTGDTGRSLGHCARPPRPLFNIHGVGTARRGISCLHIPQEKKINLLFIFEIYRFREKTFFMFPSPTPFQNSSRI